MIDPSMSLGVAAKIAEHIAADEDRDALMWLATMVGDVPWSNYGREAGIACGRTIQRKLAQPRLMRSPPDDLLAEMMRAYNAAPDYQGWDGKWAAVYRAVYAYVTKPKTKTVWDVTVFGMPTQRSERQEHVLDVIREFGATREIMIVPREVPA